MKHFSHQHSLILNENYIAREDDMCSAYLEEIVSCRSFIYSCSSIITSTSTSEAANDCVKFLLHKTCAELPQRLENPTNREEFLVLIFQIRAGKSTGEVPYEEAYTIFFCDICHEILS